MRLVRLLPSSLPTRGRHVEERCRSGGRGGRCGGGWGQRRLLRLLTLLCLALAVAGLALLAVSEVAIAQKRAAAQSNNRAGIMGSRVGPAQHVPRRPPSVASNFRVEPLLRRDAPSVELSTHVALNLARARHLACIIAAQTEKARHILLQREGGEEEEEEDEEERRGVGMLLGWNTEETTVNSTRKVSPPDCPPVPPGLMMGGYDNNNSKFRSQGCDGGAWQPQGCTSRHRVAVVIPYRDRWQHLLTLLGHLHPVLQRQQLDYRVFVVEQYGNDTFNKGAIMNAAFLSVVQGDVGSHILHPESQGSPAPTPRTLSAKNKRSILGAKAAMLQTLSGQPFQCFVFHDVDLLPEDPRNIYSCPVQPRHMSVAVDELNYRLPYKVLVGGVFAIRTEHFFQVNGYSNLYWGWGGEDDDMGYRVQQAGLLITRPPEWIARYRMIKHVKRRPLAWKVRNKLLRTSGRRYRLDGLNTAQFRVLSVSPHRLFTRLLVDVGRAPNNIRALQDEADGTPSPT